MGQLEASEARVVSSAGGMRSSGTAQSPWRAHQCPKPGLAVTTANGIARREPSVSGAAQGTREGATAPNAPDSATPNRVCGQNARVASRQETVRVSRACPLQLAAFPRSIAVMKPVTCNDVMAYCSNEKTSSQTTPAA